MKFAKSFATALLFITLLPLSGFAGDQQTPGCAQPAPTNTTTNSAQSTSPGSSTLDTLIVDVVDVLLITLNP